MEAKKVSVSIDTKKDEDDVLLPGFRFHPTDQELVEFYLTRKVEKRPAKIELIKHVDIYKYEPWDLPKVANRVGDREWYFYCKRGRKYKNSIRPNRVTVSGFWKATGIDKPIQSLGEFPECIGLKKSLVYYRGSAGKGTKTDWMMHEFRLPAITKTFNLDTSDQEAEVWTLCRILKRDASFRKFSPDWKKFSPKQSFSDASSKTSYSESEIQNNYRTLELSGDKGTETKLDNQRFHDGNLVFTRQLSLTNQVPFTASLRGFSRPNGEENLVGGDWDELRPMVEFALNQSVVSSLS